VEFYALFATVPSKEISLSVLIVKCTYIIYKNLYKVVCFRTYMELCRQTQGVVVSVLR